MSWARTITKSSCSRILIKFPKQERWWLSVFPNRKADPGSPRGYLRSCRKATRRCTPKSRSTRRRCCGENRHMWLAATIALVFATNAFGQQKATSTRTDSGSDLLWKKLHTWVRDIADKFEGMMGVAILDLTDGRILLHNGDRVF